MERIKFWISIKDEYSLLGDKVQWVLIPLSTSYLCEIWLSTVALLKKVSKEKRSNAKGNEGGCIQYNFVLIH